MEHGAVFGLPKEALLAFITAVCMVVSIVLLVRDVHRKQAQPYLWSWIIRCGLCVAMLVSQIACGATHSLALPASQVLCTFVIIAVILRSKPKLGRLDGVDSFGVIAALSGVALWVVCGNPLYGVIGTLLAEMAATTMGVRAALKSGRTESQPFWTCSLLAAQATIFAAGSTSFAILLPPVFSACNALVNIATILIVKQSSASKQPTLNMIEA